MEWISTPYSNCGNALDGAKVVLAKSFSPDVGELDASLASLHLGRFASIEQVSKLVVRVSLDNGLTVEFFGDTSDDDEYFPVFCPHDVYIEFSDKGWQLGRSDVPWRA